MVIYVENECCHVSSLYLVIGNIWSKTTHPLLVQRLGDGGINNVVDTSTLIMSWQMMFGENKNKNKL